MKYIKMLGLMALAATAFMAFAASASATNLTSPAGTNYTGKIHATSEGITKLDGAAFNVECEHSTVEGTVETHHANTHASTKPASGKINVLTFSGCGVNHVTVVNKGSLLIHTDTTDEVDGNGTLTSTGAEISILNTPTGITCVFTTNGTDVGTLTGSKHQIKTNPKTETATLDINSASIPRTGGSFFCGSSGIWTGYYEIDVPMYLDVD